MFNIFAKSAGTPRKIYLASAPDAATALFKIESLQEDYPDLEFEHVGQGLISLAELKEQGAAQPD